MALTPAQFDSAVLTKVSSESEARSQAKSMIIVCATYNTYVYQVIIPKEKLTSTAQYFCVSYTTGTSYYDAFYVAAKTSALSPGLTHNGSSVTASATFEYYVD